MIKRIDSQRGEGRMGTFFGLFVVAVVVYLGVKVLPVMVTTYTFRDFLVEEARFAALKAKDEDIKKNVLAKAKELELPINAGDIKINRTQSYCDISVAYTILIETPFYTYNWAVNEQSRAPLF